MRYAIYNRTCGHVLDMSNGRAAFAARINAVAKIGRHDLRTRVAIGGDRAALKAGESCNICTYVGVNVASVAEAAA